MAKKSKEISYQEKFYRMDNMSWVYMLKFFWEEENQIWRIKIKIKIQQSKGFREKKNKEKGRGIEHELNIATSGGIENLKANDLFLRSDVANQKNNRKIRPFD